MELPLGLFLLIAVCFLCISCLQDFPLKRVLSAKEFCSMQNRDSGKSRIALSMKLLHLSKIASNAKLVKSKMKCWCCPHRSHKKIRCIVFDLRSSPPWIWRKYERRPLGCLYLSTPLQRRGWVSPLPPIVS